jgi:hypothetical protein
MQEFHHDNMTAETGDTFIIAIHYTYHYNMHMHTNT